MRFRCAVRVRRIFCPLSYSYLTNAWFNMLYSLYDILNINLYYQKINTMNLCRPKLLWRFFLNSSKLEKNISTKLKLILRKNLTNYSFKCFKVIPLEELENFDLTTALFSETFLSLLHFCRKISCSILEWSCRVVKTILKLNFKLFWNPSWNVDIRQSSNHCDFD